ncbi:unnamed protein product [Kluyveromyces dobzhanskii CBS 2104]|uniref:H/ACA ribonucleoprotein complex non-core subunit NAF1 n=1 Tax=Kluyveromyces dobzhanskii CBS 2104 TaxID=1427455 RepID=A0A0A8LBI5_9SACH|nr:unnamed protein product [Kluyveromyces dobzhanskii CBS 2104]
MSETEIDLFEQALQANDTEPAERIGDIETDRTTGEVDAVETNGKDETARDEDGSIGSSSEDSVESSSSSDSSDDDDDDDDDDNDNDNLAAVIDEGDDDEPAAAGPIKSVHELEEEPALALPEDFAIAENATINEIGTVKSAFEHNIIITASVSGEQRVLKEGSVLCLHDKTLVGPVFEVFGPLQAPLYRVSFDKNNSTSSERFNELKSHIGDKIFYVSPEARWVDTFELKQIKGTDASNGFDEELPEHEQEFSDDEKEMEFKRRKKLAKKRKNNDDDSDAASTQKPASRSKDPLPSSNKSTVTYRSRNIRENRGQNTDHYEAESNGTNSNKRPRNHRPHAEPPVPANPMQFPPNFPNVYNPQFSQPMMYPPQQQSFNNGGFYQPPYPAYPNQQFLQQHGVLQYRQLQQGFVPQQQGFVPQQQFLAPQQNMPPPHMLPQLFPHNGSPLPTPVNTFTSYSNVGNINQQHSPQQGQPNDPNSRGMSEGGRRN